MSDAAATLPIVHLHGFPIHAIDEARCIEHVLDELDAGRGGFVVTHNLDHLRRLRLHPDFAEMCDGANLRVADGMPLAWAARLRGTPLPERVAGSTLTFTLTAAAAERGRSVFFLGGDPGTADAAAAELRRRHPELTVAGTECPPFGFDRDDAAMQALRTRISSARPDIVYVALGSPKQERIIVALRDAAPQAWWIGVGISFSFVCGDVKRAPGLVQRLGFEWLHRLAQEPRRLFRRYLIDGIPYAVRLWTASIAERGRVRRGGATP